MMHIDEWLTSTFKAGAGRDKEWELLPSDGSGTDMRTSPSSQPASVERTSPASEAASLRIGAEKSQIESPVHLGQYQSLEALIRSELTALKHDLLPSLESKVTSQRPDPERPDAEEEAPRRSQSVLEAVADLKTELITILQGFGDADPRQRQGVTEPGQEGHHRPHLRPGA